MIGVGRGLGVTVALSLSACSNTGQPPAVAEGKEHIFCAVGGEKHFRKACAVERSKVDGATGLVVRHPDGGFRRFLVPDDAGMIVAADGAEQTVTRVENDAILVTMGQDRYLFPATKMKHAGKP